MSEGEYHSDLQAQRLAQNKIEDAVRHGEWTLEEFLRRYEQVAECFGLKDPYANQMKRARIPEGVTAAMEQVFGGLRAAWWRAQQLSVEVQRPRDQALADIRRLPGHGITPDTRKG
ncbi:hypothetical protein [Streptomyces sp. AC627_RSS907]|uniref:hypothetical protein n=1 Tax=Streptomyces sp. AC627_RSS907 TaxID=2823684 RepID=UPI001C24B06D|nr:hypothetical protein [Streptomyces sp. AC627_RSS907]